MVKGQLCRGMSKGLHYRPVVDEVAFDETSFDRKKGAKTVSLKIDQLISATFSITPLSLSLSLSSSLCTEKTHLLCKGFITVLLNS